MKALSLLLATISGAGFLFRGQLQTLVHPPRQEAPDRLQHHQAPEGVYYLRTAYNFTASGGTARWSPGQELRSVENTAADEGTMTLTDGVNTAQVSQTAITRDMDDAAALRQMEASNQNIARQQDAARQQSLALQQTEAARRANPDRLVAGQFHSSTLDVPTVRTNRLENVVSTAAAPVIYSVNRTVIVGQPTRSVNRVVVVQQHPTQSGRAPAPVIIRNN